MPTVTIGLPVYNGERFLAEAIESALGQTWGDLELIVSDNASTDATEDIARGYAARDRRLRYERSATNRGAAWNFNHTVELARGRYFKWAAHDDRFAPEFVERCLAVLEADPTVVACSTGTQLIDVAGRPIETGQMRVPFSALDSAGNRIEVWPPDGPRRLDAWDPCVRFEQILIETRACLEDYAVIRTEALRRTSLVGPYYASDKVHLAELALLGRFEQTPETLFFRRCHPGQSTNIDSPRERQTWIDPGWGGGMVSPRWRCLRGYVRALRMPLSPWERARCLLTIARWMSQPAGWRRVLGLNRLPQVGKTPEARVA